MDLFVSLDISCVSSDAWRSWRDNDEHTIIMMFREAFSVVVSSIRFSQKTEFSFLWALELFSHYWFLCSSPSIWSTLSVSLSPCVCVVVENWTFLQVLKAYQARMKYFRTDPRFKFCQVKKKKTKICTCFFLSLYRDVSLFFQVSCLLHVFMVAWWCHDVAWLFYIIFFGCWCYVWVCILFRCLRTGVIGQEHPWHIRIAKSSHCPS